MLRLVALFTSLLGTPLCVTAAEPLFRRHDVNLESTFPACAAVDVNQDGRLDLVCGGWWYAAPDWERHYLREVQPLILHDISRLEEAAYGTKRETLETLQEVVSGYIDSEWVPSQLKAAA